MLIRKATADDVDALVDMGAEFAAAEYADFQGFDRDRVGDLVYQIVNGIGACLVAEAGEGTLLGGMCVLVIHNPFDGVPEAHELAWWVSPAQRDSRVLGPKLYAAAEKWAREQGARRMKMVAPPSDDGRIARFYERKGYRTLERTFQKDL